VTKSAGCCETVGKRRQFAETFQLFAAASKFGSCSRGGVGVFTSARPVVAHNSRAELRPIGGDHHADETPRRNRNDVRSSRVAGRTSHRPRTRQEHVHGQNQYVVVVANNECCKACEPHTCICGKPVNAQGLHGLTCRKSSPRQQRHSSMNDILWSVESCETGADSSNKGTGEFDSAKQETPRWQHIDSVVQRQANGLGCHCPRHLCRITYWRHCHRGRCSGEPGSGQQNRQVR